MKNKKIFIVEDDANLLYGLESQFVGAGFEVEVSEANEEVDEMINNIKEFNPHYIVLDLILPKIDGFELVKRIKEDDELSEKEIFIFTDLSEEDSRSRSLEIGADYVFFKENFDTFEFAEKVIKIIANRPGNENELEEDDGYID
jgi:DNA-binding response OmpR family regulator